jgi:hypothetical protein
VKIVLAPTSVSRDIWAVAGRREEACREGKSGQKKVEEEEGYTRVLPAKKEVYQFFAGRRLPLLLFWRGT